MQHSSSAQHRKNLERTTVLWESTSGHGDNSWSIVCYANCERWHFDNSSSEQLTVLGTISDGLGAAEILENSIGAIFAIYATGPEAFSDSEAWLDSLPDSDREEAELLLQHC